MDYLLLALSGLVLIFLGGYAKKRSISSKAKYSQMVDATVVSFTESGPIEQGETTYFPVLEYTYKGKTYKTDGDEGVANSVEIGKVFTILINPDKPEETCLYQPGDSFLAMILKVFGYFMIFSAILMTVLDFLGL